MQRDELPQSPQEGYFANPAKPRTLTVLGFLVAAAAGFSYLGAFAVTSALIQANVIAPISKNPDPRPLWAMSGFAAIMTVALLAAMAMRHLSRRQFQRIDQMLDDV